MAAERVEKVTDICDEGDTVKVKVMGLDDRGKVRLSMKVVDQDTGEDISDQFPDQDSERPKTKEEKEGLQKEDNLKELLIVSKS